MMLAQGLPAQRCAGAPDRRQHKAFSGSSVGSPRAVSRPQRVAVSHDAAALQQRRSVQAKAGGTWRFPEPSSSPEASGAQTSVREPLPQLQPLDASYEANHTFSDFANWLIPGQVMLGRYPFIEPSRCLTREKGEQQLAQILEAGVSTFVCLQEELPSQEQLKLVGKNGFMPYKSTAELIQASLNERAPSEVVNGLRNPSLNKFLPAKKNQKSQWKPKELQFMHSPIVDLGLPSPDILQSLLADLQRRLEAGEKLYIHCWGGRGRAGTVGACLLASMYGTGVDEALARVQRAYDTRKDDQRLSPETDEQFDFVRQYIATRTAQQKS